MSQEKYLLKLESFEKIVAIDPNDFENEEVLNEYMWSVIHENLNWYYEKIDGS